MYCKLQIFFDKFADNINWVKFYLQRMPTGGVEVMIEEFRMVQPGKKNQDGVSEYKSFMKTNQKKKKSIYHSTKMSQRIKLRKNLLYKCYM